MLDLDGANQMRGNIEFVNPRDIVGADRIDSQSVETDEVDIGGTVIDSPIASLLKTVSEQDCTHGININNDVVSCVAAPTPVTPPPTPSNCTTSGGTLVSVGTTQSVPGSCSGAGCIPGVCSAYTAGVRPGSGRPESKMPFHGQLVRLGRRPSPLVPCKRMRARQFPRLWRRAPMSRGPGPAGVAGKGSFVPGLTGEKNEPNQNPIQNPRTPSVPV